VIYFLFVRPAPKYCRSKLTIKYLSKLFIVLFALTACAGTPPNPIRIEQLSDSSLSCDEIKRQVQDIMSFILVKKLGEKGEDFQNMAAWITGQFLLIPMLGMDVTGARKIEMNAFSKRLSRLHGLAEGKKCS